ncbi:disease resistance protein At4g27190-like [Quercus suber]|uniref:Disease resistance protein n=1 Tax=Quercus suber TaxID=58331 RepID=A0AAW0LBD4_QUESU
MEILISIASKIAEYSVAPVGQWLCYSFHYDNNIKNMTDQVNNLEATRDGMQIRVEAAENNVENIAADVVLWLKKVDDIIRKAKEFLDADKEKKNSSQGACLNLKRRHKHSKTAKKMLLEIDKLLNVNFGHFSQRPASQDLVTSTYTDYMTFNSRMSIMKDIMEALGDADINLIGVWGMPGVGKSTLVKEVAKKVKEEKLFDEVAISIVKQNSSLERIQKEISETLDLTLDKDTLGERAKLLNARLTKDNNKKRLVILDDIWEKLNLEKIGIPPKGCKVVVTSRNKDILTSQMGTQKDFGLHILPEEEAWKLFEKLSGNSLKDSNLRSKAMEVSTACEGLPLALVTVATALKNKHLPEWEDALQQLKSPNSEGVMYSAIELSYNYLESEELQPFFLLCAQIGSEIYYQDLLKKCFGLRLFHGINTLEKTRNRTYTLLRSLKDSGLLLDAPDISKYARMHDRVRDAALSIASKTQYVLMMRDEGPVEWPNEDDIKICTSICVTQMDINEFPENLNCPELITLLVDPKDRDLSFKIPDTFFKGMRKLEVIDLTYMRLSSLPSSLMLLTNLKTLCLDQCVLGDIAMIGEMKNLEILSLIHSEFKELPREIGFLTHLRMLDLSECKKLQVIPANVLSCLIQLEELFVGNSFTQWEVEGLNNERASLAELKHLSQLTTLEVHIPNANLLPKDLLFKKLIRYKIVIGDVWDWYDKHENSRILKLKLHTSFQLERGIKMLLNGIEDLILDELKGVQNIIYELDTKGFQQLKYLHVQNNVEIKYIIDSRGLVISDVVFPALEIFSLKNMLSLEEICNGKIPLASFCNLRIVKVEHCEKLKFIFSSSIAKSLSQLQTLEIRECSIMGAIVIKEECEIEDRDTILFPQLRHLVLHCLPKFMSFLSTQKSVINDAGEIIPESKLDFQMPILQEQVQLKFAYNDPHTWHTATLMSLALF